MFALASLSAIWLFSLILPLTTAQSNPGFKKFHDFSKSCTNITLNDGPYLSAYCAHSIGSKPAQYNEGLDLNLCIGSISSTGELEWDIYGKLSDDCKNCVLDTTSGFFLQCECTSWMRNPKTVNTTLDLDTGIGNWDGQLVCYTTGPTSVSELVTAQSTTAAETTSTSTDITTVY